MKRFTNENWLKVVLWLVFSLVVTNRAAFAEPLLYRGNQQESNQNTQGQTASSPAVPVLYGSNYDPQFSSYASFMQAPQYSAGPLQRQYMQSPYPGTIDPAGAAQDQGVDPYAASEVSPYSKYSPYMEIIGEGSDYTLGIDDVITVIVRNQPDFSGRFVIDPDGNVQYPFVGDIPAEGKTKQELKAELIKRLKKFVRYPEVAVMISEYRSKAVYVFGFVNSPGKYAMKGDKITVKEAVVAAGLPRMDGSLNRVYIIRPSQNTKDGKPGKKKVNLNKLLNKGESAEDFLLEPGDTIVVNQRYFDKFVNAYSRLVGPVFQTAAVYNLAFGAPENGFFGGSDNN
ncbi:MAG: polysaccharide export protein [Candidatus Omnitrophica bacterium]|nr:polysaccharide export protein [Candidatus Omnitrophota bacterium]